MPDALNEPQNAALDVLEASELPDRAELLALLVVRAREKLDVSAIKLLLEELRRDADGDDDAGSTLDRLDNVTPIRVAG